MALSHSITDIERGDLVSHVLVLAGFGLIGIGAVLPWIDKELPLKVYVLGEQMGVERIWVRRLLVVAGVGALVEVGRFRSSEWRSVFDLVLVGIGGLVAVITITQSPLIGKWLPGHGVYLTLFGSVLVTFGASISLITTQLDSPSEAL
ncbi:hypothetical protein [Halalkaliarchaeum desulfuricum]|uniref:hypothetical protein n=1 Tax=Halalkaliarchaeum desulfuricum TaxID=2055893 RepID=UPI000E6D4619|nr:hypothetical protein [Halalkaliarchaeum desulfuricum]